MVKYFFTLLICSYSIQTIHAQQLVPADDKSAVIFAIKNFGIKTGGNFKGLSGQIEFDKSSPDNALFNISIDAATVNTDNSSRDNHLRKEEYFDTEKYPKITFRSSKVSGKDNGFTLSGKLTIKGIEKNISFPFTVTPKDDGFLFEGSFQINRRDFKIGGNSMVLGDEVTVTLSILAVKK